MTGKFVTGLPLTPQERERDAQLRREATERGLARKHARRTSQHYNTPATPGHRRIYDRMIGERDD